jgi:hypothetical protein
VVTEEGEIMEKLSEDTERLMIVIGSVLSIIALAFSIYPRMMSRSLKRHIFPKPNGFWANGGIMLREIETGFIVVAKYRIEEVNATPPSINGSNI